MNKNEFIEALKELEIDIDEAMYNQFSIYATFLMEYNEKTNLTAIKDVDSIYLKHFYDSLTIVKALDFTQINTLMDVGSGAGFPGVVLKIAFPKLNVTLIDSNNKKTTFLKELINKLKLENITVIHGRSEEYAHANIDKFDVVTARAVTNLAALSELCIPLVKVNGFFIALKANATEEIENAKKIIKVLNSQIENIIEFNLPHENAQRTIITIRKTGKTPPGYPRKYDKIKKSVEKMHKIK